MLKFVEVAGGLFVGDYEVDLQAVQVPELVREQKLADDATVGGLRDAEQDDRVVAKLTAMSRDQAPRRPGSAKGSILYMAPDFDAPMDDLEDSLRRVTCSTPTRSSGTSRTTRRSAGRRSRSTAPTRPSTPRNGDAITSQDRTAPPPETGR